MNYKHEYEEAEATNLKRSDPNPAYSKPLLSGMPTKSVEFKYTQLKLKPEYRDKLKALQDDEQRRSMAEMLEVLIDRQLALNAYREREAIHTTYN